MGGLFRSFTDFFDPGKGRLCLIRGQGRAAQGGVAATAGWAVRLRNRNRPTQFSKGKEWWAARPGKDREGAARYNRNITCDTRGRNRSRRFCAAGRERTSHRPVYEILRFRVQSLKPASSITATSGVDKWPSLYAADLPVQGGCFREESLFRFYFVIYLVVSCFSFLSIEKRYITFCFTSRLRPGVHCKNVTNLANFKEISRYSLNISSFCVRHKYYFFIPWS